MKLYAFQYDWVTATTKSRKEFQDKAKWFFEFCGKSIIKESSRAYGKTYKGYHSDMGIFMGERLYTDKWEHIFIFEGEIASCDMAREIVRSPRWHKTRIDCQVTIEGVIDPVILAKELRERHSARGHKPTVKSIDEGTEFGTVYVGSRKSDRYARIYSKIGKGDEGDIGLVRYEIEIKGKAVQQVCINAIGQGMSEACKIEIIYHLENYDIRGEGREMVLLKLIRTLAKSSGEKIKIRRVKDENKTLEWLRTQVYQAMSRVSQSHSEYVKTECIKLLIDMLGMFGVEAEIHDNR